MPERDIAYYQELWSSSRPRAAKSRPVDWDEYAKKHERRFRAKLEQGQRHNERALATLAFLRGRALLGAGKDVIDIGCGPGRFAAEFAPFTRHVLGVDISPQMLEYAKLYAQERGCGNVGFQVCDFRSADVAELGWEHRFDLVFSSITPAVTGPGSIEKMIAISRGWCYNSSFVHGDDQLDRRIMAEVFGREAKRQWDGRRFQAMFNILWLMGYCPETSYYKQHREEMAPVTQEMAEYYAEKLLEPGEVNAGAVKSIYQWLSANARDGAILEVTDRYYGWILFDTRLRRQ